MRVQVWLYTGAAAWHFVTVPKRSSDEIKKQFGNKLKRGWGSVPVEVTMGTVRWNTSIFPDKKAGAYLLPIKADVRKKVGVKNGDTVRMVLKIRV